MSAGRPIEEKSRRALEASAAFAVVPVSAAGARQLDKDYGSSSIVSST